MAEILENEKIKRKRVEEADSATSKDSKADSSIVSDDITIVDKVNSDADDKRDGNGPDDKRLERQIAEHDSVEVPVKKVVSVAESNLNMTCGKNEYIN